MFYPFTAFATRPVGDLQRQKCMSVIFLLLLFLERTHATGVHWSASCTSYCCCSNSSPDLPPGMPFAQAVSSAVSQHQSERILGSCAVCQDVANPLSIDITSDGGCRWLCGRPAVCHEFANQLFTDIAPNGGYIIVAAGGCAENGCYCGAGGRQQRRGRQVGRPARSSSGKLMSRQQLRL